jgi:hypothetical protein
MIMIPLIIHEKLQTGELVLKPAREEKDLVIYATKTCFGGDHSWRLALSKIKPILILIKI